MVMETLLSWMGFGILAFALAIVNLIRVSGSHTGGSQAFVFGSLSCGLLAMLDEYRRADALVKAEDMTTLGNVISWTCTMLMVACFLLIILNLLSVAICMGVNAGKRHRDRKALTEAQRLAEAAEQRAAAAEQRASELAETPTAEDWQKLSEENAEKEKIREELTQSVTPEDA